MLLDALSSTDSTPAVLTASPLHWRNLLQQQPSSLFEGFVPLAAAPMSALSNSHRPAAAARTAGRVAEVQSKVLAIAADVIGAAIEPQQSLMEVRFGLGRYFSVGGAEVQIACSARFRLLQ